MVIFSLGQPNFIITLYLKSYLLDWKWYPLIEHKNNKQICAAETMKEFDWIHQSEFRQLKSKGYIEHVANIILIFKLDI